MDNQTTIPALLTQPAPLGALPRAARVPMLYKLIFVLAVAALVAVFFLY